MALINVVSYPASDSDFVFKYPSDDLRIGTQVVVGVSQVAFLVRGGQILDQFDSGTHTITSQNIPLLNKIINLPFGTESPFKCEIWYVNLIAKLDIKWGTSNPIQIEDRKYGIIFPVRAYGQYGFRICEPRRFLEALVGNMTSFTAEKINDYFRGKVLSNLSSILSSMLVEEGVSILEVPTRLSTLSALSLNLIGVTFRNYGIELLNFDIISVNIPDNDPSLQKLKEAQSIAAKLRILGWDVYRMDRGLDILEKAAQQDGNSAGALMNAGIGLGAGIGLSGQLGGIFNGITNSLNSSKSLSAYHIIQEGKSSGPYKWNQIIELIKEGMIGPETYIWKPGLSTWKKAGEETDMLELLNSILPQTPPPFIA